MCWTITIGTGKSSGSLVNSTASALGPPVEAPIATISTGARGEVVRTRRIGPSSTVTGFGPVCWIVSFGIGIVLLAGSRVRIVGSGIVFEIGAGAERIVASGIVRDADVVVVDRASFATGTDG